MSDKQHYSSGLSDADWKRIPLAMRQHWWKETNFGRVEPSPELMEALLAAAKELYGL